MLAASSWNVRWLADRSRIRVKCGDRGPRPGPCISITVCHSPFNLDGAAIESLAADLQALSLQAAARTALIAGAGSCMRPWPGHVTAGYPDFDADAP